MSTNSENLRHIGPFQLEKQLGVGGMGIVYAATYEKKGLKCAVKILSPDLSGDDAVNQRFIRETEILKKLRHPNIIRYYGAGSNRTQRFYAMELIDGGSLADVIKKEGRLSWELTITYAIQIAKALEHAHNAGIVHRDLKPANLLLTSDGILKLSDFGIARDADATALTKAGHTVGTMRYMAPEQISGNPPISRRTDLYSLGCVLFEMLTGRLPFESETQAELLFKHIDEVPPSVREFNQTVPIWLSKLIDELLAKDPEDRPFDALAVQVKLEEVRQKVQKQEEKLKASTAGGASMLTEGFDQKTARLNKKKKKQKAAAAEVPFYERGWFLGILLGVIVLAAGAYVLQSRSEGALFARAQKSMQNSSPVAWVNAEPDLKTMLARYPEGKHSQQARDWLDQIEMYRTERRIESSLKRGEEPANEAERLYLTAREYEKIGDRLTALEKYEAMPKVLSRDEASNRPYLNLARREAAKIRAQPHEENDRTEFLAGQLKEADQLFEEGKKLAAREKWRAILQLYGDNREFDTFTRQARSRLDEVSSENTPPK